MHERASARSARTATRDVQASDGLSTRRADWDYRCATLRDTGRRAAPRAASMHSMYDRRHGWKHGASTRARARGLRGRRQGACTQQRRHGSEAVAGGGAAGGVTAASGREERPRTWLRDWTSTGLAKRQGRWRGCSQRHGMGAAHITQCRRRWRRAQSQTELRA